MKGKLTIMNDVVSSKGTLQSNYCGSEILRLISQALCFQIMKALSVSSSVDFDELVFI